MDTENDQEPILPGSTWRYFPSIAAASWSPRLEVHHLSVTAMRSLLGQGFTKITLEQSSQLIALEGQLCEVLTVERAGKLRRLARKADRVFICRTPVALLFRAPVPSDRAAVVSIQDSVQTAPFCIEIAHNLPPPTFGECALLWEGTTWRLHDLSELTQEAQQIQAHLAARIHQMAAPAMEWLSSDALRAGSLATDLTLMRQRHAADPVAWHDQWTRLRASARQLAACYWRELHHSAPREAMVDTTSAVVTIPGDVITQTILRSLLTAKDYRPDAEHTSATWHSPVQHSPVTITMPRQDGESWQHLLAVLDTLGDETVDTFCALVAISLTTHGSRGLSHPFFIAPDDILACCGRKQSHRVYTTAQRSAIIHTLSLLSRIQVSFSVPAQRPGRLYRLQSPIVEMLQATVGEYTTSAGDVVWQRQHITLGSWAAVVPELPAQTVGMLRTILSYHPQKDRITKRLGRFFALHCATERAPFEIRMQDLLVQAGVPFDPTHHQDRTRTTIERALQDLIRDHIIQGATPLIAATPEGTACQERIAQCGRGWWHDYAQQVWRIDPVPLPVDHQPAMLLSRFDR